MNAPEPVFEAPWHAQVFALTVHLHERALFDWADWTAAFGATLKAHGLVRELNGGDDYFHAWLETLETLLQSRGIASDEAVAGMTRAWKRAYLATPHGAPVRLEAGREE